MKAVLEQIFAGGTLDAAQAQDLLGRILAGEVPPEVTGALLIALRTLTGDRWAALAAGFGMMALILLISQRGPGGSVVVPNTPLGNIWMYVAAGIVVLVVMWPDLSKVRRLSASAAAAGDRHSRAS